MKKIIFCDIDGTLAKRMHLISKKNIQSIKAFTDKGGDFVLCTGRSIVSAYKFQEQISEATKKEPNYIICSNGGYIIDNKAKTIITYNIANSISRQIYERCKQFKIWSMFYTKESNDKSGVFASKVWFWRILKMFKSLKCFKIYQNTNLNSFKIILVCAFPKRIKEFTKVLDTEFKDKVSYINTNPYLIEINAITTSKASAARYILEKAGLTSADAAAFGDSPNDIPMFKEVSLPISIRTNKEKIIKATKYHIPKFRNGVSKAINKYILE